MSLEVRPFTRERIPDVLDFEKRLREEEPFPEVEVSYRS